MGLGLDESARSPISARNNCPPAFSVKERNQLTNASCSPRDPSLLPEPRTGRRSKGKKIKEGTRARTMDMNNFAVEGDVDSKLAGIEYVGVAGASAECQDAVLRFILFGDRIT